MKIWTVGHGTLLEDTFVGTPRTVVQPSQVLGALLVARRCQVVASQSR